MKEKWRKIIALCRAPNRILLGIVWSVTLATVVGSILMACLGYTGVFSYIVYAIAALSLAYSVYTAVRFAPTVKAWVLSLLKRKNFTRNLTENYSFRTLVFAACSAFVNIGFVAFNTVFSILTKNGWYGSLAGYYFLLTLLRVGVFWGNKRARENASGEREYKASQLKNYRFCGLALLLLDLTMVVPVTFMVLDQKPTQYSEIMAIVFAAYTFYKLFLAVWNIFKARKTQDMQIQSFRNIGLADGAISLLSLQTTLISTFSAEGESMLLLNAVTGAFVCLLTIGIGLFMMIRATKKIRGEKREKL